MYQLSVIIPSRTVSNLAACTTAVRENEPFAKIIVIDDGLGTILGVRFTSLILGKKPFRFSRAINTGIDAAMGDVLLLNDDALLKTPCGFSGMQKLAEEHLDYGMISATTNVSGNAELYPENNQGVKLREAKASVPFICVFIPRRTIEVVGMMDERFESSGDGRYGWEDNDMDRRVRAAGFKVGIAEGCFVDHGSLRSTFRGDPRAPGDGSKNAQVYLEKWGSL